MSSRAPKPASWFTNSGWLGQSMAEYKQLRAFMLLIKASFDEMAVSDGTATCHLKDKAFVYESQKGRNDLGPRLDSVLQAMVRCDEVEQNIYNADYDLPGDMQSSFHFVLENLNKFKVGINKDTLALLDDCITLRSNDEWSRTVYGKAVAVRSRKALKGKDELEHSIIDRLINGNHGMMERAPVDGAGYVGQFAKFVRASIRPVKHFQMPHFMACTLDSIHDSRKSSEITRAVITRIQFKGEGRDAKSSLKKAYRLDFKHSNGRYEFVTADFISDIEVGQIFEMESKVLEGQTGTGITSADDEEWLAYIKENFGLLLWVYMVNHPGYADADFNVEDTKKLVYANLGNPSRSFTLNEADKFLASFDFDGGATNPSIPDLVAAASIARPGYGMGTAKYIGALFAPRGFEEVVEPVGLNIHHIRSGTGDWINSYVENITAAHKGTEFGVRIALSGEYAVPYKTAKFFDQAIEVADANNRDIAINDALNLAQVDSLKYFCR